MDGQVGNKVLFENERVKVWDITLDPGDDTGLHTHELEHFVYLTAVSEMEVHWPNGASERRSHEPGVVQYRPAGDTHSARNVGDSRLQGIIVEFK